VFDGICCDVAFLVRMQELHVAIDVGAMAKLPVADQGVNSMYVTKLT
jgi:hypothetical protein